jgi:hypothetical protein
MSNHRRKRGLALRSLVLSICVAVLGVALAQTAVARTARTSPVGSYKMSYWLTNTSAGSKTYRLVLKRSGRFSLTVPLMKVGGTWKEASTVVTLTTPKVPGNLWVYTVRLAGPNLGSQSHPGTVTLDGKRWGAKWYAVRNSSSTGKPSKVTASTMTSAVSASGSLSAATTSEGRLLWNLEALLRATFGNSQPASSDLTATGPTNPSNPPPNSTTGNYVDFNCAGDHCAPLSTYSPYWYTFSDPIDSTFHLSQQNYRGWSFGNYPEPVLINGKIVACDPQENTFLIKYFDASSFTLACMAPQSRD